MESESGMSTHQDELHRGIRAAMQYMKDRQAHVEDGADENTYTGQYRLGLADGYGKSIGLLEEMTGVSSAGLRIPEPRADEGTGAWVSDLADEFIKDLLREET